MTSHHLLKTLLFASLLAPGVALAGPAAEQGSMLAVRGVKITLAKKPERFDPHCVDAMPEYMLADLIQPLLAARLTAAELREMDAFYGSDLGIRFNAGAAAPNAGSPEELHAKFSEAERGSIGRTLATAAAEKYFAVISSSNPDLIGGVQERLRAHMKQCVRVP